MNLHADAFKTFLETSKEICGKYMKRWLCWEMIGGV